MPVYIYTVKTKRGRKIKGEIETVDEKAAITQLKRKNFEILRLKPKPKDLFESIPFLQPKVKTKDLVIFARQFSTMIDAGLPIIQGLNILADQSENPALKKILKEIARDVEGGATLADSLRKHPKIFDELFVNLVAAGETGGILDVILRRLSSYLEKAAKLKAKIKGAMTYPIVVVGIAIIVIAVILIFVIPVFQEMFASFGKALPAPTQFVVNLSNFTKKNIHWSILGLGTVIYAFKAFRNSKKGRRITDDLFLKMPIFGELLKKVAIARFTRTLGTMIQSGVPILDALEIVAKTSGNVIIEEIIYEVRASIAEGQSIADPLSETDIFPGMVVQMISVGEATGALDTMLEKIADFYDDEVDAAVEALTSMLEPLMLLFLGGTIGGLVISMYLPIFQMAGAIGG